MSKAIIHNGISYTFDDDHNVIRHHGIKGQKWGIRRYQNEDGSLTPEGRKRYLDNGQERGKAGVERRTPEELGYKRSKEVDDVNDEFGKMAKAKCDCLDSETTYQFYYDDEPRTTTFYARDKLDAFYKQRDKTQKAFDTLYEKGYEIEEIDNDWDEYGHMYTLLKVTKDGETYYSEKYNGRYDEGLNTPEKRKNNSGNIERRNV